MDKLHAYYSTLKIGDPSDKSSQLGPLISEKSFNDMQRVLIHLERKDVKIYGGQRLRDWRPKRILCNACNC